MILQRIDGYLLSACERFSHKLQRTTGVTNYTVAKIGCGLTLVSCLTETTDYFTHVLDPKKFPKDGVAIILDCVWFLITTVRVVKLDQAEKNISENPALDKSLTSTYGWRLLWIGFSVLNCALLYPRIRGLNLSMTIFASVRDALFAPGLVIFYYFAAVKPLPPATSKIKEFIRGLFTRLQPVRVEG